MKRTPSHLAQFAFDTTNRLHSRSFSRSSLSIRTLAKAANKFVRPLARKLTAGHVVDAHLYGQRLRMPAEHPLPLILDTYPQYNRPLALSVKALAATNKVSPLTVVDIGANIGETIAVIEQRNPGLCSYLCIEADGDIAEICRRNHGGNPRVQTEQCFIGEDEGAIVRLEDDGRANPSTKRVEDAGTPSPAQHRLVRLDTVVTPFAQAHGSLSLIKVDTEGYDFSVLRSSPQLLKDYQPALYFEWYPDLIEGLNENACDGFDYLATFGYQHFVFFTSVGDYYCKLSKPDRFLLQSLAKAASQNRELLYFDVFASTTEPLCNLLVELSVTPE